MTSQETTLAEARGFLARNGEDLGLTLDGTLESIEDLDIFFDERWQDGAPVDTPLFRGEMKWKVLFAVGVYLGDVIAAHGDATWARGETDSEDPWEIHLVGNGHPYKAKPLQKVVRRYEEGPDNSLASFAEIAIALFRGELSFMSPGSVLG